MKCVLGLVYIGNEVDIEFLNTKEDTIANNSTWNYSNKLRNTMLSRKYNRQPSPRYPQALSDPDAHPTLPPNIAIGARFLNCTLGTAIKTDDDRQGLTPSPPYFLLLRVALTWCSPVQRRPAQFAWCSLARQRPARHAWCSLAQPHLDPIAWCILAQRRLAPRA